MKWLKSFSKNNLPNQLPFAEFSFPQLTTGSFFSFGQQYPLLSLQIFSFLIHVPFTSSFSLYPSSSEILKYLYLLQYLGRATYQMFRFKTFI